MEDYNNKAGDISPKVSNSKPKAKVSLSSFVKSMKPLPLNVWLFFAISLAMPLVQISLYSYATFGIYINAIVFALLIRLAIWKDKIRELAISVAILPVATMISLSLPQTNSFAKSVVFYDAILILGLIYRFMFTLDQPVKSSRLTVRGYLTLLPIMVVTGQVLGAIGYLMLRHHYSFVHFSLPLVAATSVVFAVSEEVIFRGLIQQRAARIMHPAAAAALSTVLYTAFSFGHNGSYLSPLFGLMAGTVLSVIYLKKQNLVLTICVNAISKLVYIGLLATFILR